MLQRPIKLLVLLVALFCACGQMAGAINVYIFGADRNTRRIQIESDVESNPLVQKGLKLASERKLQEARTPYLEALKEVSKPIPGLTDTLINKFVGSVCTEAEYLDLLTKYAQHPDIARRVAYLLKLRGDTYTTHEEYIDTVPLFSHAADLANSIGDPELAGDYKAVLALRTADDGKSQASVPYFEEALQLYTKAKVRTKDSRAKLNLAMVLINYGDCLNFKTQLPMSIEDYSQAFEIRKEVNPSNIEGLAEIEEKIGVRYEVNEKFDEAEKWYRKALARRLEEHGPMATVLVVKTYKELYQAIDNGYRFDEEVALLHKAIERLKQEELTDLRKTELVDLDTKMGLCYEELGQFENAQTCYKEALGLTHELKLDYIAIFPLEKQIASCYDAMEQNEAAERAYRSNLETTKVDPDYIHSDVHHESLEDLVRFLVNMKKTSDSDPEVDKALKAKLAELQQRGGGKPLFSFDFGPAPSWWTDNEATIIVVSSLALFLGVALGAAIWFVNKSSKPPHIGK